MSEYAKDVLLKEPVTMTYRNLSADDFLVQMLVPKKEPHAIGNNVNQAVQRLHKLDHFPKVKAWAIINEATQKILQKKVEEIQEKIQQIYLQWSQEYSP